MKPLNPPTFLNKNRSKDISLFSGFLKTVFILCFCFILENSAQAQWGIHALGTQAVSNSGKVDYSVGQIFYHRFPSADQSFQEGVQQTFESLILKEERTSLDLSVKVYPIPATETVFIEIEPSNSVWNYELMDANGRLILKHRITDLKTEFSVRNLMPGNYQLILYKNQKETKVLQLIKLNKS